MLDSPDTTFFSTKLVSRQNALIYPQACIKVISLDWVEEFVEYPVKIGYSDKSGSDENIITDAKDRTLVSGWGDCCHMGGIRDRQIADAIVKMFNRSKPVLKVGVLR